MSDYKTMYYSLTVRVVDTTELLIRVQRNGEESIPEEVSSVVTLYLAGNSGDTDQEEKTEF